MPRTAVIATLLRAVPAAVHRERVGGRHLHGGWMTRDGLAARITRDVLAEIGVPEADIRPEARLLDLMADEDATFWFIPEVEARLRRKLPRGAWERVETVADVLALIRGGGGAGGRTGGPV